MEKGGDTAPSAARAALAAAVLGAIGIFALAGPA